MYQYTGIRRIANKVHDSTVLLAAALEQAGNTVQHDVFFDTIKVRK